MGLWRVTVPFSLWVSDSTAYQRDVGVCHRLQRNSHGCNLGLSLHILYSLLSICHNDSLIIQYENYVLPTVPKYDSWNAEMFSKTRELHGLFSREKKKKTSVSARRGVLKSRFHILHFKIQKTKPSSAVG